MVNYADGNLERVLFRLYISLHSFSMTDEFVKEQVRIIQEATKAATQSKETAIRFLEEAGIIKKSNNNGAATNDPHSKKKK